VSTRINHITPTDRQTRAGELINDAITLATNAANHVHDTSQATAELTEALLLLNQARQMLLRQNT
jgi:hypothetical protein